MRKPLIISTLILIIAGLSGCAHQCIYSHYPSKAGTQKVGSGAFGTTAKVGQLSTFKAKTGLNMGKATILNVTDDSQSVNYKFTWLDANGVPVGESNPLTPLALSPNQRRVVTSVSPDTSATHFTLQVCR